MSCHIRPGAFEDIGLHVNLWNALWPDLRRDVPGVERDYQVLPPEKQTLFWLAESDSRAIGFLECCRDSGSYHPLKWMASIGVLPECQRQGVGAKLYDFALDFLSTQSPISLTAQLSDQNSEALRFAQSRGFEEVKRDFESILRLQDIPPEVLEKMSQSEVTILPASQLDSPDFRREWHQVFEEVRKDTPRTDPPTPLSFEEYQGVVLNDPTFLWEGSQIALVDGRMAGFSGLYSTDKPTELYQWLTAVRAEFRGRNVAQALKAASAKWALGNGFQTIRTDNDTRNAAMLSINDRMGYQRLFGLITLVKRFAS